MQEDSRSQVEAGSRAQGQQIGVVGGMRVGEGRQATAETGTQTRFEGDKEAVSVEDTQKWAVEGKAELVVGDSLQEAVQADDIYPYQQIVQQG